MKDERNTKSTVDAVDFGFKLRRYPPRLRSIVVIFSTIRNIKSQ
jgi:hypothetical protein